MREVVCRHCGQSNVPQAKFCSSCGESLGVCSKCGSELRDSAAAFCNNCGTALASPSEQSLHLRRVDNSLAWALAFAPLLGVVAAIALSSINSSLVAASGLAALTINVLLSFIDERMLKKAGVLGKESLLGWAVILIPVYLYKRSQLLEQTRAIPIIWCACFICAVAADVLVPSLYGVPIDSARLEAKIAAGIQEQSGLSVTVQCPSNVMAKPGTSFQCIASGDGSRAVVNVQVQNSQGDVVWQVQ